MSRFTLAVAAVLTALFMVPSGAEASSWFVSTTGSDSNSGSMSAPLRTITKAASLARPGDSVEVRAGVYYEVVKIASKGTSSARITFRPYSTEKPVIDGTGSPLDTNLVQLSGAEWVDFTGFEVRNATRIGICGYPVRNVRITNNAVHHAQKNAIYIGSSSTLSSDVVIEGNDVHDNVLHNQYHTLTGGWSQAIGVRTADRTTVRRNYIHGNDGEGIAIVLSDGALVEANEVADNYSVGIYLDNAQSSKVDGNFVYSTGNSRYYRDGYPAAGIGTANESYTTANPLTGLTITNNIVVDSKWGFYYGNYEAGGGLKASTVANNTFYRSWKPMIWIDSSTHTGTVIENNIFDQSGGAPLSSVAGTGATYRNNLWWGGSAGAAAGSGDVIGDPQFARAGGLYAADYKIASASIALDRALSLSAVADDYFGTPRAGAFDIGAHESTLSAAVQPGDTQAPTVPSSLRVTGVSSSSVSLAWYASTDNVGVTGYKIYRNGVYVTTVSGTSWQDSGRSSSTTYSYTVAAADAAGNVSAKSNTVSATTSSTTTRKRRSIG